MLSLHDFCGHICYKEYNSDSSYEIDYYLLISILHKLLLIYVSLYYGNIVQN
ncbi:hypothetical protein L9F63_027393, partial [Diploptera punctata]